MGHSSKKKKRSGGGRGRASSKDSCAAVVDENLLADELTALWVSFDPFISFVLACYYIIRDYSHMRSIIEKILSSKPWKVTFNRN